MISKSSPYQVKGYTPDQGDIIVCNFDSAKGREIQKLRPALVVSSYAYNGTTGFCVVCPITSAKSTNPGFVPLAKSGKVKGHINSLQLEFIDFINQERKVRFIEKATTESLATASQFVEYIFDFDRIKGE